MSETTVKTEQKQMVFQGCPMSCPRIYCYLFLPFAPIELGTRKLFGFMTE